MGDVSNCGFSWFRRLGRSTEFGLEKFNQSHKKWIGVDFDGTLAEYRGYTCIKNPGPPIDSMVQRVKDWLNQGINVKIFTARVCSLQSESELQEQKKLIENWCVEHIGKKLEITNEKDFFMIELWDNRAVGVIENRGIPLRRP